MAFDEKLGERLREAVLEMLGPDDRIEEKKMFGGLAQMVNGHMCVGIIGDDLVLRATPEDAEKLLAHAHVRPMDFTGRPMKGWFYVAKGGTRTEASLRRYVAHGFAFVRQAGPKDPSKKKAMSLRSRAKLATLPKRSPATKSPAPKRSKPR